MLKVMIVDDEALVRIGIKSCIEWEKHDMEFVGQAEDGEQALELIKRVSPDIVLTDILMPNMDGIQLIERIAETFPHIKVIVLSCHSEMDAVKRAMRLGAQDYILKLSMQPENLLDVLKKTKVEIEKDRQRNEEKVNFEKVLRSNKQVIKNGLYKKWLSGSIGYEEFLRESSVLQVQPQLEKRMLVICCTIDDWLHAPAHSRMKDSHLLRASFLNILEEGLADFVKGEAAEMGEGEYMLAIEHSGRGSDHHNVARFFQKINQSLKRYLNITVSFAVSGAPGELREVPALYAQAQSYVEYRFYKGKESLIFSDKLIGFKDKEIMFGLEEEKLVTDYIYGFDPEGVKSVLKRFFDRIAETPIYHPIRVKTAALNVLYGFKKMLESAEEQLPPAFAMANLRLTESILNAETLSDLVRLADEFVDHFFQIIPAAQGPGTRSEIVNIKRHVCENIELNLSLEDAAKICNMSRSYFSFVFKKEVGESFTNFVNRTKMERARELILGKKVKVYEAAEKVGIRDEAYFSKVFKKYIGVSPGKIKKS
ncbi:two-component system, response regulator YesN [Paenibacillus sp. UNCCL117]|uniref:response regulator transcription factor n=1 Tax=unclassified Paenibacillus TaxID=185978 RepID=UPI0008819C93|nr:MULTISPECIES: response regulator [unclassified Paenibacillus]SDD06293.1 two component transcriptional regulator, AraC family [Paenibacillus sp. cl123]SFW31725.1 two-component system, response regulator YesN [Paenibacillus sp. UNCCL117]